MTGETLRDSGNGEGGDASGGGKVADSFRELHDEIKDSNAALRYPASGDQPATINLLHMSGSPEYTFVKIFDDESLPPRYYSVKVDDEKVGLSVKTMMTKAEIEEKGSEDAEAWMKMQDLLELSIPKEADEIEFAQCFADMMVATKEGTLVQLDLSGGLPPRAESAEV